MSRGLGQYRNIPGEVVTPYPYHFEGAVNYSFVVKCDMEALNLICKEWINEPGRGKVHVRPLMPFVMVSFVEYPSARSVLPEGSTDLGFVSYKEAYFSVFVTPASFPCNLSGLSYGLMPFLFVDDYRAITAGREAFHVPKVSSEITIPPILSPELTQDPFVCRSLMVGDHYGEPSRIKTLIEVKTLSNQTWKPHIPRQNYSAFNTFSADMQNNMISQVQSYGGDYQHAAMLASPQSLTFLNVRQYRSFRFPRETEDATLFTFNAQPLQLLEGGMIEGDMEINLYDGSTDFPLRMLFNPLSRVVFGFWFKWNFLFTMGSDLDGNPLA